MDESDGATAEVGAAAPSGSAGVVAADAGVHIVVERPPPGLARGAVPAPAWVVLTLGVTLATAGAAALVWRALARRRPPRGPRARPSGVT